jgi:hypothetical protein
MQYHADRPGPYFKVYGSPVPYDPPKTKVVYMSNSSSAKSSKNTVLKFSPH